MKLKESGQLVQNSTQALKLHSIKREATQIVCLTNTAHNFTKQRFYIFLLKEKCQTECMGELALYISCREGAQCYFNHSLLVALIKIVELLRCDTIALN